MDGRTRGRWRQKEDKRKGNEIEGRHEDEDNKKGRMRHGRRNKEWEKEKIRIDEKHEDIKEGNDVKERHKTDR